MNALQQTIKSTAELEGVGLHTGQNVQLKFHPAPVNHGIKFKRVDLPESPVINADVDLVVSVDRGTTIEKGPVTVSTVEHLLSAVAGLEIDNILVELNGAEIPILDGSAKHFIQALENAGIEEQEEEREVFELTETLHYKDQENGVEILAMPSEEFKVTTLIDYQSKVLGQQHASMENMEDFTQNFAEARTFCFLHELEQLLDANLIKGGDLNNAIVVVDRQINEEEKKRLAKVFNKDDVDVVEQGILNNVELRYPNEPARHKLLDVVGDLMLVGTRIKAHIIATKPGHKSNVEFAKKIKKHISTKRKNISIPKYDPSVPPLYNIQEIEKMLPHKYPFLLVDKIIHMTDKEVVGIKNVTFNEPHFTGHFPSNPVMPGVLQIEAMAQAGGILALNTVGEPGTYDTYFLKIDKAKFKQMVVPGDTLILKLELLSPIRRGIIEMKGTAFVGNKVAAEAELMARIYKKEKV